MQVSATITSRHKIGIMTVKMHTVACQLIAGLSHVEQTSNLVTVVVDALAEYHDNGVLLLLAARFSSSRSKGTMSWYK